ISAAAGTVTGFIDGVGHAAFAQERLAELSRPPRLLILARADPQHALEQPLEMKRAERYLARDRSQGQRHVQVLINIAAGRLNLLRLRVAFQRRTAQARPVSGLLRLRR